MPGCWTRLGAGRVVVHASSAPYRVREGGCPVNWARTEENLRVCRSNRRPRPAAALERRLGRPACTAAPPPAPTRRPTFSEASRPPHTAFSQPVAPPVRLGMPSGGMAARCHEQPSRPSAPAPPLGPAAGRGLLRHGRLHGRPQRYPPEVRLVMAAQGNRFPLAAWLAGAIVVGTVACAPAARRPNGAAGADGPTIGPPGGDQSAATVGETVASGTWQLTVTRVAREPTVDWSSLGNTKTARGVWLVLQLRVENVGRDAAVLRAADLPLRDAGGQMIQPTSRPRCTTAHSIDSRSGGQLPAADTRRGRPRLRRPGRRDGTAARRSRGAPADRSRPVTPRGGHNRAASALPRARSRQSRPGDR